MFQDLSANFRNEYNYNLENIPLKFVPYLLWLILKYPSLFLQYSLVIYRQLHCSWISSLVIISFLFDASTNLGVQKFS